jgi:hypothetical protein
MVNSDPNLLRQYELLVNSAIQVTGWRQTANGFYLTVNTTLLAVASYLFGPSPSTAQVIGIIGVVVSILWYQNINYFRNLNSAKFKVIHSIEKKLPVQMFKLEDDIFKKEKGKYSTQIEKWVPLLFALAYGIVLILPMLPNLIQLIKF